VAYRDFRYVIPFLVQLWMFATPTVYMQPENFAEPISPSAQVTATRAVAIEGGPARRALAPPAASEKSSRYSDNHEGAVPNYIQTLMNLNPMVGLIAGFRAAMLGGPMPWHSLAWSGAGATVMFIIGCLYFRHVEDSFADVI
jgi:lipopolysaccharide transport system permease protein